mmetsp:Transcript_12949/g.39143  ORF Transcript_12949/g.39143 Transcript_12949/m.39143 type:complete len:223 (+) Transcript_12949:436-1104(+)
MYLALSPNSNFCQVCSHARSSLYDVGISETNEEEWFTHASSTVGRSMCSRSHGPTFHCQEHHACCSTTNRIRGPDQPLWCSHDRAAAEALEDLPQFPGSIAPLLSARNEAGLPSADDVGLLHDRCTVGFQSQALAQASGFGCVHLCQVRPRTWYLSGRRAVARPHLSMPRIGDDPRRGAFSTARLWPIPARSAGSLRIFRLCQVDPRPAPFVGARHLHGHHR